MNHIMIDLETLDTSASAVILSIGAVFFDRSGMGREFYQVIDIESCKMFGLTTNKDTENWWAKQSAEARTVFTDENKVTLPEALHAFSAWVMDDNVKLWGNGAAFDNAIMSYAYRACGMQQPWKFWNDRCYRTINAFLPQLQQRKGVYHNALDDAKTQAEHLIKHGASFL